VSFWGDMAANAVGGIVTAVILGGWATRFAVTREIRANDARVADLEEDNRRWIRDRNAQLEVDVRRTTNELAAQGQTYSGAVNSSLAHVRRGALKDYRDEMTRKRRRYAAILDTEGGLHRWLRRRLSRPLSRFELTPEQRQTVESWRAFSVPGDEPAAQHEVPDDPTSEESEPDLRRFEREGDPPHAGQMLTRPSSTSAPLPAARPKRSRRARCSR
jgi:hypothetical protein